MKKSFKAKAVKQLTLLLLTTAFAICPINSLITVSANTSVSQTVTSQSSQTAINLKNNSGTLDTTLPSATVFEAKVFFNGQERTLSMPLLAHAGRTYLPLRALGEELLGATVDWDGENGIAIVTQSGTVIETFAGSNKIVVNGEVKDIDPNNTDARAFVNDGRTYIPVRAIAEAFGADVYWQESSRTIFITNNGQPANPNHNPNISAEEQAARDSMNAAAEEYYNKIDAGIGINGEPKPTSAGTHDGQMSPGGDWMWFESMRDWLRG